MLISGIVCLNLTIGGNVNASSIFLFIDCSAALDVQFYFIFKENVDCSEMLVFFSPLKVYINLQCLFSLGEYLSVMVNNQTEVSMNANKV